MAEENGSTTEINPNIGGDTQINTVIQNGATEINPAFQGASTEINQQVSSGETQINGILDNGMTDLNAEIEKANADIPAGTVILSKYVVERPLSKRTGEARLYICGYQGKKYVAKIYRRVSAIKDEVLSVLKNINAPNVARLYDTGMFDGFPVEIIPYYAEGNLENRTFTYETLRDSIIPELNEGLHILHQNNIIHKDIKPSNIMLCDDRRTTAIIDFGISSVREGGNTVVVTRTGMTPEFSAPETFRNVFLEESDYYSLGVTIYTLFCGHTPYSGANKETIEKYVAIQKIPFPEDFPDRLKELVVGLTYNDITNRKDKSNPNRRWTYDEVRRWCRGESLPIPGGSLESHEIGQDDIMPSYTFMYNKYTSVSQLTEALAKDWKNGKKRLYRSALTSHFKSFNSDLANYCADAEDTVRKDPGMEDVAFFECLYRLNPNLPSFNWKDEHYDTMELLGLTILRDLRSNRAGRRTVYAEFLQNHLFSIRERCVHHDENGRARQLKAIEDRFWSAVHDQDVGQQLAQMYLIGYLYSKSKELITTEGVFTSVEELANHVKESLHDSPVDLERLANILIFGDNGAGLLPEFQAWLISQGKGSAIGL